ncbi:hypothetical protein ACWGNZ_00930 [Sphingomonas zeae]
MAARWSARAAVLRAEPDRGSQNIAGALERISGSMMADVSAAGVQPRAALPIKSAPTVIRDADYWSAALVRCQPYRCPTTGIMFNEGEIMDRVRARIAALRDGRPVPPIGAPVSSTTAAARVPEFAPPPEVVPFTMGPQTDMFGMLG